jgi:1,2-diacylglycerol 3-alpha-glucosyltransferase
VRIGFFTDTYTPQINGVVSSIRLFAEALERQGHSVFIFGPTPRQTTDGPNVVRMPSVPYAFQPEMRLASVYSVRAHRHAHVADLDIVHSHSPFAIGLFGLAVARRYGVPYVHTYHTLYSDYLHYLWETDLTRAATKRLSREFCDKCDVLIAPSTKLRHAFVEWGVRKPAVVTLPTGVETWRFAARDTAHVAAFRLRHRIPAEDRVLAFVGRLGKEKNVDLLVQAMKFIRRPHTRLLIVGDGPHRAELERRIDAAGVRDRVTLTGYIDPAEVPVVYQASDAMFFASTTETQGLVIAEAMAAGLPVVAVDDPAIADAVQDGVNGFLVPQSAVALAEAAERLLADELMHRRMSDASLRLAASLDIDRQTERLVAVYELALAGREPSERPIAGHGRSRRMPLGHIAALWERGGAIAQRARR